MVKRVSSCRKQHLRHRRNPRRPSGNGPSRPPPGRGRGGANPHHPSVPGGGIHPLTGEPVPRYNEDIVRTALRHSMADALTALSLHGPHSPITRHHYNEVEHDFSNVYYDYGMNVDDLRRELREARARFVS